MSLLNTLYNLIEVTSEDFTYNNIISSGPQYKTFTIAIDNLDIDISKVKSVLWNFGDPFKADGNEIIRYDLNPITTFYEKNGIYTVNCIIHIDNYIIHLNTKVDILIDQDILKTNIVTADSVDSIVTIFCYDPVARIEYLYYDIKNKTNTDWKIYSNIAGFTLNSNVPYIMVRAFLSTGVLSESFVYELKPLTIGYMEVFDPIYNNNNIVTGYTTGGNTNMPISAYDIISHTFNSYSVSANRAIKISLNIGGFDILESDLYPARYYKASLNGNVDNFDSISSLYTDYLIIDKTDTVYFKITGRPDNPLNPSGLITMNFEIYRGIDSDIESLSLWVGDAPIS